MPDSFTVKKVSNILHVTEETVRRWIRTNKIEADREVGRNGSKINTESIIQFVMNNEVYKTYLSTLNLTEPVIENDDIECDKNKQVYPADTLDECILHTKLKLNKLNRDMINVNHSIAIAKNEIELYELLKQLT